jgi:hypothetical protein
MGEYRWLFLASLVEEGVGVNSSVEGIDSVKGGCMGLRHGPPTLSKLGRKYHHH